MLNQLFSKKAISPVVATILLLSVTIFSIVIFQNWFGLYQSNQLDDENVEAGLGSISSKIDSLEDNKLYFVNANKKNITIVDVKINGNSCGLNGEFIHGINELDISNCLFMNRNGRVVEIMVQTTEKIYTKTLTRGNPDPICDDLVLLYHFDNYSGLGEGTDFFYDFSHNGYNGVCSSPNCPTYNNVISQHGYGLSYDGDNSYVDTTLTSNLDLITISAWIYPNSYGEVYGRIFDKRSTDGSTQEILLFLNDDGDRMVFNKNFNGGAGEWMTLASTIQVNNAYHIVLIYNSTSDSNHPVIYINGALQTLSNPSSPNGISVEVDGPFVIGNNLPARARGFDGVIDEFIIWNRLLDESEVLQINNNKINC